MYVSVITSHRQFTMEFGYMTEDVACASLSNLPKTAAYWYARWFPVSCQNSRLCTVCGYNDTIIFKLRGLCDATEFDRTYVLGGPENGKPAFLGISFSRIVWTPVDTKSTAESTWKLILDNKPGTVKLWTYICGSPG